MMTLRNFAAAGLDMKNKGDYESTASQLRALIFPQFSSATRWAPL
jgi:hypothetical protein